MSLNVKVVAKTFKVLEALNCEPKLSLKEITARVELPKSTVFRLLNTLQTLGYIEQDMDSQTFTLSSKFTSFFDGANKGSNLLDLARPYMEKLRDEYKETVNLAKLVDDVPVYINVMESSHSFRISDSVGDRASFHSTAIGKSIIAFLPDDKRKELLKNYAFTRFTKKTIMNIYDLEKELAKIKRQGYATDNEEGHDGVICIGAPIFNKHQYALAAISISMPKVRAKKTILNKLKKELPQITQIISSNLGVKYVKI